MSHLGLSRATLAYLVEKGSSKPLEWSIHRRKKTTDEWERKRPNCIYYHTNETLMDWFKSECIIHGFEIVCLPYPT
ncbi:hypothetical protein D3C75_282020 [compost metagenome]